MALILNLDSVLFVKDALKGNTSKAGDTSKNLSILQREWALFLHNCDNYAGYPRFADLIFVRFFI